MIEAKDYVKKLTTVPEKFIDEFFTLYDENTMQTDFVVNLNYVSKWLDSYKRNLVDTLVRSYKKGLDYIVTKPVDVKKKDPRHNNYKLYLLTPDCFKRLAMMSRSKNAEMVRTYFIEIENLFIKYRSYMLEGMKKEVEALARNQRTKNYPTGPGFIYIISAGKKGLYKIGRTKDLAQRMRNYQSGLADDIDVLYVHRAENISGVEGCVKGWLKEKRYRKYKEVYQADITMIKDLISSCGKIGAKLEFKNTKARFNPGDNHYIVMTKDDLKPQEHES